MQITAINLIRHKFQTEDFNIFSIEVGNGKKIEINLKENIVSYIDFKGVAIQLFLETWDISGLKKAYELISGNTMYISTNIMLNKNLLLYLGFTEIENETNKFTLSLFDDESLRIYINIAENKFSVERQEDIGKPWRASIIFPNSLETLFNTYRLFTGNNLQDFCYFIRETHFLKNNNFQRIAKEKDVWSLPVDEGKHSFFIVVSLQKRTMGITKFLNQGGYEVFDTREIIEFEDDILTYIENAQQLVNTIS